MSNPTWILNLLGLLIIAVFFGIVYFEARRFKSDTDLVRMALRCGVGGAILNMLVELYHQSASGQSFGALLHGSSRLGFSVIGMVVVLGFVFSRILKTGGAAPRAEALSRANP